jgi:hypothetical protein
MIDPYKPFKGLTVLDWSVFATAFVLVLMMLFSVSPDGVRCVGGYKHTWGTAYEAPRQIFDEHGKGIPCDWRTPKE